MALPLPLLFKYKYKGTELDFIMSYTPQLNGRAEKTNRSLMEKAKALLFGSRVEKTLWREAFLFNRSPTKFQARTPVEMWTGQKPAETI